MNLKIIAWNVDSGDGDGIKTALDKVKALSAKSSVGKISLQHDLLAVQTEQSLGIMRHVVDLGYNMKTVAQCLGVNDEYTGGTLDNLTPIPPVAPIPQIPPVTMTTTSLVEPASDPSTSTPRGIKSSADHPTLFPAGLLAYTLLGLV
jgi:hypothetical protein